MSRSITVGGAQLGPIARNESRQVVVGRLLELMREAHGRGCDLVTFPELALTSFFPRWWLDDEDELDSFFEREMPSAATRPLFELAVDLGIGFYLGYAELVEEEGRKRRFNSAVLVDKNGRIVGKYRKVHLPGHADDRPHFPFQHLEKRYFEVGDLGFGTWRTMGGVMGMCICNDRRWPETFRVMALQGAEMVVLGYNTPTTNIHHDEPLHLRMFHHRLCMQAAAYQNGMWVVGTAKAGKEDGHGLYGGSCIVAPTGEIVAQAMTEGDEVITYTCDLDLGNYIKDVIFNFAEHRRIEHYGLITERTGAEPPPE